MDSCFSYKCHQCLSYSYNILEWILYRSTMYNTVTPLTMQGYKLLLFVFAGLLSQCILGMYNIIIILTVFFILFFYFLICSFISYGFQGFLLCNMNFKEHNAESVNGIWSEWRFHSAVTWSTRKKMLNFRIMLDSLKLKHWAHFWSYRVVTEWRFLSHNMSLMSRTAVCTDTIDCV